MSKLVIPVLALLAVPLFAQSQRVPASPVTLIGAPAAFPALGATALGTADVVQMMAVHDRANPGKFLCALAVTRPGSNHHEVSTGTWDPATQTVALDSHASSLLIPGAGVEENMTQVSLSSDGLTIVADTPARHPVGLGGVICAVRSATNVPFGIPVAVAGLPAGYIAPQLCMVRGRLSLLSIQGANIMIADLSITKRGQAGMKAVAINSRIAIKTVPGSDSLHSPTAIVDKAGEAHAYLFGRYVIGSGSDAMYHPATEAGSLQASRLLPGLGVWLGSSMSIPQSGTAYYSDSSTGNRVPKRIEFFATSGGKVGSAGGTITMHTVCPPSMTGYSLLLNFGSMIPRVGLGIGGLGLISAGDLSLNVQVTISAGVITGTDLAYKVVVPLGAIPKGVVIDGQAIAFNQAMTTIVAGNNFAIE